MNLKLKGVTAIAAIALLGAGTASAQLNDGLDGSNATSVFISVVERDDTNAATRNLVIDTGLSAFQIWDGSAVGWSTTSAQSTAIQGFLNSATGTVSFNLGAGLTLTNTGRLRHSPPPARRRVRKAAVLRHSRRSIPVVPTSSRSSDNANGGTFVDGVLEVPGAADPGFHDIGEWGNNFGGAIQPSNEILFGDTAPIQGWRLNFAAQGIVNETLALLTSDASGNLGIAVVPVPAAVWLFGSALGLLGWVRRRAAQ